jgi:hypothetical protein
MVAGNITSQPKQGRQAAPMSSLCYSLKSMDLIKVEHLKCGKTCFIVETPGVNVIKLWQNANGQMRKAAIHTNSPLPISKKMPHSLQTFFIQKIMVKQAAYLSFAQKIVRKC